MKTHEAWEIGNRWRMDTESPEAHRVAQRLREGERREELFPEVNCTAGRGKPWKARLPAASFVRETGQLQYSQSEVMMLIRVPIGAKDVASIRGRFSRTVICAHCHETYAFDMDLQAKGESHDVLFMGGDASAAQARRKAEENLVSKSKNVVVPIPCPACGCYQKEMVDKLKEDASINSAQITGAVIVLLSFLPLAFSRSIVCVSFTVVLALVGICLLVRGILQATRFDPSAGDPEPRKAMARSKTVWGKDLEQLRAKTEAPGAELGMAQGEPFEISNELEEALVAAKRGKLSMDAFIKVFLASRIAVPNRNKEGGGNVTFSLPLLEKDGVAYAAIFSNYVLARRFSGQVPQVLQLPARSFLEMLEGRCGVILNPGEQEGFELSASGIASILKDFGEGEAGGAGGE